jgi:hypothetical protein
MLLVEDFLGGFFACSESCELIRNDDTERSKLKSSVKAPFGFFKELSNLLPFNRLIFFS